MLTYLYFLLVLNPIIFCLNPSLPTFYSYVTNLVQVLFISFWSHQFFTLLSKWSPLPLFYQGSSCWPIVFVKLSSDPYLAYKDLPSLVPTTFFSPIIPPYTYLPYTLTILNGFCSFSLLWESAGQLQSFIQNSAYKHKLFHGHLPKILGWVGSRFSAHNFVHSHIYSSQSAIWH